MTLPQQNTASARSTSFYYLMCQLDRVQYPAMTQALLKLRLMMTSYKQYIPDRQDLIWINFKPSVRQEIRGRHPAIVISSANYSRLTGLVMVMPITHGTNNRLKSLFIPLHAQKLEGYINPLQTYTFSIEKRNAQFIGEIASAEDWARAISIHKDILGI